MMMMMMIIIIITISVAPTMNTWKLAAFPKTITIKFKGVLLDPLAESSNVRFHGRYKMAPFLCRRVKQLFH